MVVFLNLNADCQLRCKWCYLGDGLGSQEMDFALAQKLIVFSEKAGANNLVLLGGETTLYSRLFDVVSLARDSGFRVCLDTNAIAFARDNFLEKVVKSGVTEIISSFKGFSAESFAANTGKNLFPRYVSGLEKLVAANKLFSFSVVITPDLIRQSEELISFLTEMKIKHICFEPEKPCLTEDFSGGSFLQAAADFITNIYSRSAAFSFSIENSVYMPLCYFDKTFIREVILKSGSFHRTCMPMAGRSLSFGIDGQLFLCSPFSEPLGRFGSDFSTPSELDHLLAGDNAKAFSTWFKSAKSDRCSACEFFPYCRSGCPLYWAAGLKQGDLGHFGM